MALKFKATVKIDQSKVQIEDVSTVSTINVGIIKLVDSMGNTIYKNTGFDTSSMAKLDFVNVTSTKKDISIVNKNNYTLDVKMRSLVASTLLSKSVTVTLIGTTIVITGISAGEYASIVAFGVTKINSIYYLIDSHTYVGTTLTIVSSSVTANIAIATVPVQTYVEDESTDYTREMNVCYTPTTVNINYTILCDTSQLTSSDDTTYIATIAGVQVAASSYTRTHSVVAPAGSGYGVISDSTDKSRTFVNIWTNYWQTAISTVVSYIGATDGTDTWLYFTDIVKGSDSALVKCSSCSCEYRECIINIYQQWIAAPFGKVKDMLGMDVLKITALYTQYLQAERCGASTYEICVQMMAILNNYNCNCMLPTNDPPSTLVVPIRDISVGSIIYTGEGNPTISANNRDLYINSDTQDLFQYTDGVWVLSMNIKGEQGIQGIQGNDGLDRKSLLTFHIDLASNNATLMQNILIPYGFNFMDVSAVIGIPTSAGTGIIEFSKDGATAFGSISIGGSAPTRTVYSLTGQVIEALTVLNIVTSRDFTTGSVTLLIELY